MKNYVQIILDSLKKHYLVLTQIVLISIALYSFLETTYRNGLTNLETQKINEVGEISIAYPEVLPRDNEFQEIKIMYRNNNLEPSDVQIDFKYDDLSIFFYNMDAVQVVPVIELSNPKYGETTVQSFLITPVNLSSSPTSTRISVIATINGTVYHVGAFQIRLESQTQFLTRKLLPYVLIILVVSLVFTLIKSYFARRSEIDSNLSKRLEIAEIKVDETPDKVKPIWDVARFTLEKYINRNQQQINLIFALSLGVMSVSFLIIIAGVYIATQYPDSFSIAVLTSGVGVITEFIGATFLIVFKSTLKQASDYSKTLERIATIGVAVQILDSLVDDPKTGNLKSKTKSEVVKLLIKNTVIISETDENDKK